MKRKYYIFSPLIHEGVIVMIDTKEEVPRLIQIAKNCIYQSNTSELKIISQSIVLTKKEKQLLDFLLANKNTIVSFETIQTHIWQSKDVSPTTRRTLIHRLREKIGSENIKTIKDVGCILEI